jgi:F420-dependent oxidoreductase-like protein
MSITHYSWPGGAPRLAAQLTNAVQDADDGGLDTVWVADHLIQAEPGADPDEAMLEAYTTLGFLAAQTHRVRLGTMVTGVTFRPPALLVKAVTALDVLSGGRAWLGVGAGYQQDEADAMGLPLPPMPERFQYLEDTLRLAHQMWAGDHAAFEGQRIRLGRPVNSPRSLQRPHPPILVGGTGERRTLPLVARYADACNVFDIPDGGATVRRKLNALARHCEDIGRPYAEIEKTISTRLMPDETADGFANRCRQLAGLGIQHVVVITSGPWNVDGIGLLAAACPLVRGLAEPPVRPEPPTGPSIPDGSPAGS